MKTIFKICAFTFLLCGILFPTSVYLMAKILPNSDDKIIYINEEIKGNEITNQDFSTDQYFHTDNIRPYITLEEAQKQKVTVMDANNIDSKTMDELIEDHTYNNLFFDYVNITTLNLSIYKLNH